MSVSSTESEVSMALTNSEKALRNASFTLLKLGLSNKVLHFCDILHLICRRSTANIYSAVRWRDKKTLIFGGRVMFLVIRAVFMSLVFSGDITTLVFRSSFMTSIQPPRNLWKKYDA